jgi:hypothetical protein
LAAAAAVLYLQILRDVLAVLAAALTTHQAVEREQQTKVLQAEMEQTLIILGLVAVAQALLDKTRNQQMLAAMAAVG